MFIFFSLAVLYGLSVACFAALISIVIVDLFGLEALTSCIGIVLLTKGVATVFGPPIAGAIYEANEDYLISFCVAGIFLTIGGSICQLLYIVKLKCYPEIKSDISSV